MRSPSDSCHGCPDILVIFYPTWHTLPYPASLKSAVTGVDFGGAMSLPPASTKVDSRAGHSVKHAAELLGLHERSVYRGISSGLIKLCASAASW
jgi:hypothetical protein